ncbi:MAG: hypothetical protein ACFE0Q_06365 [Anaerolineae bacterium]
MISHASPETTAETLAHSAFGFAFFALIPALIRRSGTRHRARCHPARYR